VDRRQSYLDALMAEARARGLADQITRLRASMSDLPCEDASFDVIWSEGAMYIMGFAEGLAAWRRLIAPGGYLAVSEPCWTADEADLTDAARAEWREYPAITDVPTLRRRVAAAGYELVGDFVLPDQACWNYYGPMEARIAELRAAHAGDAAFLAELETHQAEVDGYRRFGWAYGYVMLVMRRG
jgi:SAM-dependent methyltransferase